MLHDPVKSRAERSKRYGSVISIFTYTYDAANQLLVEQTPSLLTTYSYDANGNTAVINAAGDRTTYSWDTGNRPTVVQLAGEGRNTLAYDGDGKRRRLEDSEGLRNFIWDGENVLREQDANNLIAADTLAPRPCDYDGG